ncbi:hypothetical protein HAX54_030480 [Datura stramonium]|uniref:Uncharacterized protein n=1 Tax=Datura stramonium TaxID=4076 RepID=A0ABS8V7S1_DATST|nr:hypothetical protein [Datura stramonium]
MVLARKYLHVQGRITMNQVLPSCKDSKSAVFRLVYVQPSPTSPCEKEEKVGKDKWCFQLNKDQWIGSLMRGKEGKFSKLGASDERHELQTARTRRTSIWLSRHSVILSTSPFG